MVPWLLFLLCSFAGAQKVRMAIYQLEPFMMQVAPKEAGGATVEYWKRYLAPRMGIELEVLGPFPIPRVMKMLENGEADVVPQLSWTAERAAIFTYPQTYTTKVVTCVMVLPDNPLSAIKAPSDFYGKKIGFTEDTFIPPFMIDDRIAIELISNFDYRRTNLNKLFAGRIDGVLDLNYVSFRYFLQQNGLESKVKALLLPMESVKIYSLFRKTKEGQALSEAFDRANREGLAAGVFDSISKEFVK
jgi:ABC-type amino acid transport substrate-binding protein